MEFQLSKMRNINQQLTEIIEGTNEKLQEESQDFDDYFQKLCEERREFEEKFQKKFRENQKTELFTKKLFENKIQSKLERENDETLNSYWMECPEEFYSELRELEEISNNSKETCQLDCNIYGLDNIPTEYTNDNILMEIIAESQDCQSINEKRSIKRNFKNAESMNYTLHCEKCNKTVKKTQTFYTLDGYPIECIKCNERLTFKCKKCNAVFKSQKGVCNHIRCVCGKIADIKCPHCNYKTRWKFYLKKHIVKKHQTIDRESNSYIINCSKCQKIMNKNETIRRNSKPYICKVCNDRVNFQCKKCDGSFESISAVYQHIKYSCGKSPNFQCSCCKFRTRWKSCLKRHIEKKHKNISLIDEIQANDED